MTKLKTVEDVIHDTIVPHAEVLDMNDVVVFNDDDSVSTYDGNEYLANLMVKTLTQDRQQIAEALAEALEGEATINGMLLKERIVNIIKESLSK